MNDTTDTVVAQGVLPSLKGQQTTNDRLKGIQTALESIAETQAVANSQTLDPYVLACIDGTAPGFKRAMKLYFQLHKVTNTVADDGTVTYPAAAAITNCVTNFYNLLRDNFDWCGWTEFYDPAVSSQSNGTKKGDNDGLTCVPSTATTKGQDDYEWLPLFACVDCNWEMSETALAPQITAIEGVVGAFDRYDATKFVGVLQMSGYHIYTNPHEVSSQTYIDGISMHYEPSFKHCIPMPESVGMDGKMRPWVVHGKYQMGMVNDKATNCSGVAIKQGMSHNDAQTVAHAIGTCYSGTTSADMGFLQMMLRTKYASLTLDTVMLFDQNNGWQSGWPANSLCQVAETGVKRFILPAGDINNYFAGMRVKAGTWSSSGSWADTSYSTSAGLKVTSVETVTIDGATYTAVYVDTDTTFSTTVNTNDATATTRVTRFLWDTGSTDKVRGNDGSLNPTDGKHPVKLQGIEFGLGTWEVLSDTILNLYQDTTDTTKYYTEPYITKDAHKQTTSITSDYKSAGVKFQQPDTSGDFYIKSSSWGSDGVLMPTEVGGSSSTYMRDSFWTNTKGTGTREWLALGALILGSLDGLSCLRGGDGLGDRGWLPGARLSPNGLRG